MGSRYLTDLAAVCRRTGFPVIEVDDWQNRARGSGGYDSGRPNHVMIHHTASGSGSDGWPDVNYICYGDEDAPLSNLYLSRNGTIYVCAAGATNTNGSGTDVCGVTADDSMNSSAIGIEAGNNGVGEPWPRVQQDSYVALVAALCDAYGIGVEQIHSHAQWASGRKIDPAGSSDWATGSNTWHVPAFCDDVRAVGAPPPDQGENDVLVNLITHGKEVAVWAQYSGGYKVWVPNPEVLNVLHLCSTVKKVTAFDSTWFISAGPVLPGTPLPYAVDGWGRKK